MFDFDKNFSEFALSHYKGCAECDAEDFEEHIPALYEEWLHTPLSALGGVSPCDYFAAKSPEGLIEALRAYSEPPAPLLDAIVASADCAPLLCEIIEHDQSDALRLLASNLLDEAGAAQPLNAYVTMLQTSDDEGLQERAVEVLSENADKVQAALFDILPQCTLTQKGMVAEILVNATPDERTYALLTELFGTGDNLAYSASLLGKYGDERAAAMLYRALDTCDYAEYLEIKNAIERLGGTVDVDRDFSDDPTFLAIKGLK